MSSYVNAELRRLVETRANHICEYCLIHEKDTYLGCQVDHIISEKHGGSTTADNLCYACTFCNRSKGTDIGSIVPSKQVFTRFYNPRVDSWRVHFSLNGFLIEPKTDIAEVTVIILGFNSSDRLLERELLIQAKRYPSAEATQLIASHH